VISMASRTPAFRPGLLSACCPREIVDIVYVHGHFAAHEFAFPAGLVDGPDVDARQRYLAGCFARFVYASAKLQLARHERRCAPRQVPTTEPQLAMVEDGDENRRCQVEHSPRDQLVAGGGVSSLQLEEIKIARKAIWPERGNRQQQTCGQRVGDLFAVVGGVGRDHADSAANVRCALFADLVRHGPMNSLWPRIGSQKDGRTRAAAGTGADGGDPSAPALAIVAQDATAKPLGDVDRVDRRTPYAGAMQDLRGGFVERVGQFIVARVEHWLMLSLDRRGNASFRRRFVARP
jgi:hypothetical protein